jgi:tRNA dimethylallyltransferase
VLPHDAVLVLTGPTAAGKKEVGFAAARRLGCEVLGLDAVKVFRGYSIGAAAPDAPDVTDAHGVPVHLVGVADPTRPFSLGAYLALAAEAVERVRAAGRIPLFVGGTPLYLRGLVRGLFDAPPADPALRDRLTVEARAHGVESLHGRLARVDPAAAAKILPRDLKRITRALEVFELTGAPISRLQADATRPPIAGTFRVAGLRCADPALHDARIRERVDRMLAAGLDDEVRALAAAGALAGEPGRSIGYREMAEHLAGACSLEEARVRIVTATRRLVRKQRGWFKQFPEIRWVERTEESTVAGLADRVVEALQRGEDA